MRRERSLNLATSQSFYAYLYVLETYVKKHMFFGTSSLRLMSSTTAGEKAACTRQKDTLIAGYIWSTVVCGGFGSGWWVMIRSFDRRTWIKAQHARTELDAALKLLE